MVDGDMLISRGEFSDNVSALASYLRNKHNVHYYPLSQMDIRHCTGCWSCWVKTPGRCIFKDDMEAIYRSVMSSGILLFASPLMAGFTSSLLKKMQDRMIPLIHPYMDIRKGELHHKKRYPHYPSMALLLEKEKDTNPDDVKIINDIYNRLALNFHSELKKIWFFNPEICEEVYDDIDHF